MAYTPHMAISTCYGNGRRAALAKFAGAAEEAEYTQLYQKLMQLSQMSGSSADPAAFRTITDRMRTLSWNMDPQRLQDLTQQATAAHKQTAAAPPKPPATPKVPAGKASPAAPGMPGLPALPWGKIGLGVAAAAGTIALGRHLLKPKEPEKPQLR